MRTFNKSTLMLGTLLSSALLASTASAQVTLGEDGELDNELIQDEIVVTGSRIQNANVISSSPVTTLDEGIFERRGVVDAVDVLNQLPSVTAAQNSSVSNGATGTASLNLRGLGTNRNLVLIDGRRLGPGRPDISSADLNQVPTPLLDRVELVTGGASAVYGSDAIAGVANFILRRDFEGVELNGTFGVSIDDNDNSFLQDVTDASSTDGVTPRSTQVDGETLDISAVFGTNFAGDKGNVAAYARYVDQNQILQGTRDISRCAIVDFGTVAGDDVFCVGSNFGPFPTTITLGAVNGADGLPLNPQPGIVGVVSLDGAGGVSFNEDGSVVTGSRNAYNFNPTNFFQRPTERYQGGFLANYELNDSAEIYLDGFFFRNVTDAQIAPSATFGDIQQINCDNPFLTAELVDIICTQRGFGGDDVVQAQINRRFVEGGGRNSKIALDNIRLTGGVRGDIGDSGFAYDVFGQFSTTNQNQSNTNDGNIQLLQESLLVGPDGQCTSGRDGCLPLNLLGTGPVDPAALASILTPTLLTGEATQQIVGGTVQGELGAFQSPFADASAAILVGGEYRKDKLNSLPDALLAVGGSTGLGGPSLPVDALSEVYEVFAEVAIPLVSGAPFAEDISFTGQYRYSDYSYENNLPGTEQTDGFTTDAYSAGLSWTPIDDIRLRGQYQRAVRAPNVFELFDPQSIALFSSSDPCAGAVGSENLSASLEQCVRTGLNPALYGFVAEDAGQLQQLLGGSVELQPETSDTITLGAVVRPAAISGLQLSVDYFEIVVDDFITNIPASAVLDGCIDNTTPAFCDQINRDSLGTLQVDGFVEAALQNIAERSVEGFDIAASYDLDLDNFGLGDIGGLQLGYAGTYYTKLEQTSFPGSDPIDCLGNLSDACFTGEPNPKYAHTASLGWQSNFGPTFTGTWRYIGKVDNLEVGDDAFSTEFGDENIFDIFASFDAGDVAEFNFGVNNVFDNDPPVTDFRLSGTNGNVYPGTYPAIGRYAFAGFKFKL